MVTLTGTVGTDITLDKVVSIVQSGEKVILLNSGGGSLLEGLAIHDYLKNNAKDVTIIGNGLVASAATIIMAGVNQRIGTKSSRYVIHNPYTVVEGDAATMQKMANELASFELTTANIYSQTFNKPVNEILDIMKQDIMLTVDEAMSLGLVTEIQDVSSFFKTNVKPSIIMNEQFNKFFSLFKKASGIKNLVQNATDGTELDFGADVATEADIKQGVYCSANDGTYTLPSGLTVTVAGNIVTDVKQPAANAEIETLNAEISELKNQLKASMDTIAELKASISAKDSDFQKVGIEFNKLVETVAQYNAEKSKFSKLPSEVENSTVKDLQKPEPQGLVMRGEMPKAYTWGRK